MYKNVNNLKIEDIKKAILLSNHISSDKEYDGKIQGGKLVATSLSLINGQYYKGTLSAPGAIAKTLDELKTQKEALNSFPLVDKLVIYDINGQKVDVGEWEYDNETLLKFNVLNQTTPTIDRNYIFIDGSNRPIENKVANIAKLSINNDEIYFEDKASMIKYIDRWIEKNFTSS